MSILRHSLFFTVSLVIYSALGWLIEAIWLHFWLRLPLIHGTLYPLPLKPCYGIGAMIVIMLKPLLARVPFFAQWLLLSMILGAYEVFAGALAFAVYQRHLWHYDDSFLNVLGYTDALHAGAWGFFGLIALYWFHPHLKKALMGR